jgi:hypothetical protein
MDSHKKVNRLSARCHNHRANAELFPHEGGDTSHNAEPYQLAATQQMTSYGNRHTHQQNYDRCD